MGLIMARLKRGLFIFTICGLLSSCGPIPFEQICERLEQRVTTTGYLTNLECGDSGYCCGAVISPGSPGGLREICDFILYGQPDQHSEQVMIYVYHEEKLGSSGAKQRLNGLICKDSPDCDLDGNSRFQVKGEVHEASMQGYACGIMVEGFENIIFIP